MIKDRVFIGTMAGMIATLIKDLPNYILFRAGIVKYTYAFLAASAHLAPKDVYSPIGYLIGILGDIITGGVVGMVAILFLERFGTDYWWYKGLIIGNAVWLFGLGVILNLGAIHLASFDPVFRMTSLIDHQLFGLAVVFLLKCWYQVMISQGIQNKN